jgi:hypothetical protein
MSNFAYIWGSSAACATGTSITQAALWQLDQNQKRALNADDGGTWAPSATINFGGAFGLVLANPFYLTVGGTSTLAVVNTSGLVTCNNGLTIATAGALACSRAANLSGLVSCTNGLSVSTAGQFTCSRYANFTDAVQCDGDVTLGSDTADTLTANATEVHHGPETHNGVETHSGTETHNGTVKNYGNTELGSSAADTIFVAGILNAHFGGWIELGSLNLDDANHNVTAADSAILIQPSSGITAARNLTLSVSGVGTGAAMKFIRNDNATHILTVWDGGGNAIATLGGGGTYSSATCFFNGSLWQLLMYGH